MILCIQWYCSVAGSYMFTLGLPWIEATSCVEVFAAANYCYCWVIAITVFHFLTLIKGSKFPRHHKHRILWQKARWWGRTYKKLCLFCFAEIKVYSVLLPVSKMFCLINTWHCKLLPFHATNVTVTFVKAYLLYLLWTEIHSSCYWLKKYSNQTVNKDI